MKKTIVSSILAVVLTTGSVTSSAAVPLIAVAVWPAIVEGAAWVGGFLLVTPTDELVVAGAAAIAGRATVKVVAKHATKPRGPIVRTGPTAGQVRSRNLDGRWRAKRSDAGSSRD
jgi:hypothetical protein